MPATDHSPAPSVRPGAHRRWSALLQAWTLALASLVFGGHALQAFPPAPPHELYGTVRDALGHPISDGAEIILESGTDTRLRGFVLAQRDSDQNYRLPIPLDAGTSGQRYTATALLPAAPFRLRVVVGGVSYLPLELKGDTARIGAPGGRTHLDLTLGADEDGNGLPDAWERAVADHLGKVWTPGMFDATAAYPGAGLSFRDVYVSGTYAMIPPEGFALEILARTETAPRLAFTALPGRTYRIESAERLGEWTSQEFQVVTAAGEGAFKTSHQVTDVQRVEVRATPGVNAPTVRFYRLRVE